MFHQPLGNLRLCRFLSHVGLTIIVYHNNVIVDSGSLYLLIGNNDGLVVQFDFLDFWNVGTLVR